MEFLVLGPLEVFDEGRRFGVGSAKQRLLLGALLVHANEVVSVDRLTDILWGDAPPADAVAALQTYVSRLRATLEPNRGASDPERLLTRAPGYVLRVDPDQIDAVRFERLLDEGTQRAAAGDAAAAAEVFDTALALWRGRAFAEFADDDFARAEALGLEELRRVAIEERADAALGLGRHAEIIGELEGVVTADPLRERPRAQLMIALYRSGREAEALRSYEQYRRYLGEELGVEPSASLQHLEERILHQDPSLTTDRRGVAPGAAVRAQPPSGTVTFLFTDVEDSTHLWEQHPQEMSEAIARHLATLRQAVEAHGGHVVKTLGDGVHAAFATAHDALQAAISAQLALGAQHSNALEPLRVRMGLHTGESEQRDGDYYGTTLNRAARLMGLAHGGQILVSLATEQVLRDALGDRVDLIDVGEHRLRGLSRPDRVFQVTHVDLPSSFPSLRSLGESIAAMLADVEIPFPRRLGAPAAFVGREGELEALASRWEHVRAGASNLVVVTGEPGIGKTALVARFAAGVHDAGGIVLYGRCDQEIAIPYEPFVEALTQTVARIPEPLLRVHIDEYGPHLAHLVPSLRRYERSTDETRGDADGDVERFRLFASVAALLEMVGAAHPILLVLDDLQWADTPTVLLLRHLVGRADPMRLLIAATYRDSEVPAGHQLRDTLAALRTSGSATRFVLAGFDAPEVVTLLEQGAGHGMEADGVALANMLEHETGGNPFFVVELLRHLTETGAIYQEVGGRWRLRGTLEDLGLPDTTREVIGHRVDRLGPDAQMMLSAAAVIGQEFELTLLARVVDQDEAPVLDELERAEQARLVRNIVGDEFHFRHALVQHALYQELGSARRSRLHLRVAEALEALDIVEQHPEQAAHHLIASRQPAALGRAIVYCRRAGDTALERLAPHEAVRQYREALALIEQTAAAEDERCELLVRLGDALRQAGDATHREVLLDAARLAQRLGDHERLVRAALANFRGWASRAGAVDDDRIVVLEAALEAVGPTDSAARARVLAALAGELAYSGDFDRRRTLSDAAIALARRLDDPQTLVFALSSRLNAVRAPHVLEERLAAADETVALARALGDPMTYWHAVMERMQTCIESGDIAAADDSLELEIQLAEELALPYPRWLTSMHRSARVFLAGQLDESERLATEAFAIGNEIGQPDAFAIYAGQMFYVRAAQGRLGELVTLVEQATAENPGISGFHGALAYLYAELGRSDDARRVLGAAATDRFAAIPLDGIWMSTIGLFAAAAAELEMVEEAECLFDLLEPFGSQVIDDGTHILGTVAQALGRLAAALHRDGDADRWFAAAEQLEGRLEAPLMQAATRVHWAEALHRRGRLPDRKRARAVAEQAQRTAVELGGGAVAARATRVLAAAS